MRHFLFSMLAACTLMLGGCTNDIEELITEPADDGQTLHTAILEFNGGIDRFEGQTRAVASDWADGARLYIQYTTTSGRVDGAATYSQSTGQWEVQYYGTITRGQTAKCEVYYFDNPQTTSLTSVTLSAQSAVFSDNQASYLYEDGVVKLSAHLKPLTGRLRFRGTAGQQVSFSGLSWYTAYSIIDNTLSTQATDMTLTVGNDGYTPYVYASFAKPYLRQITVDSGDEDYAFRKTFDDSVLATGKSGFLDIPTMTSRNGWQLVDGTQQDFTVLGNGKTVTFKMIKVKPGTFQMGSTSGDSDEKPVHSVTLTKSYYMGETEVTQALWYAVMGQNPTSGGSTWSSTYGLGDNYPAYYVSYEDCQQFVTKLNQMTGQQFRFPTEAEWEFAARGGMKSKGYTYSGSNTIDDVAWYTVNSYDLGSSNANYGTHQVKTKSPNELGLYDMSGNVWEWCYDWYGSYSSSAQTDPTGASSGSYRVYRGGSWLSTASDCRTANRNYIAPTDRNSYLGFRLAL
ncbi:MAG: SUMF1/EgtB/PvdO family nonheme iron enzyme [Prevotella sp.]|nr:SUMF1/EgtB/PvdO family nonheme iron enzyme [Prevotella sp.]